MEFTLFIHVAYSSKFLATNCIIICHGSQECYLYIASVLNSTPFNLIPFIYPYRIYLQTSVTHESKDRINFFEIYFDPLH